MRPGSDPGSLGPVDSFSGLTLVLGGSGFLGAHVVAAAVRRARAAASLAEPGGPPVVCVARRPAEGPSFCQPRDAAKHATRDLAMPGVVEELLERARPARVLCCAALATVADCEREPELARALNSELPARLGAACARAGARLVYVSTDLVFGARPAPPGGFGEEHEPAPLSLYGETKLAGERALLAACPEALVVRLPLLYGNSGGRGRGASDSLLEAVDRDLLPPLFVDEWRTPLEVSNAAEALVEAALTDARGLLHVAGPERISRHGLGLAVLRAMGLAEEEARAAVRAVRRSDVPAAGPRAEDTSLRATRARALLRTVLLGVEAGLERSLR